ncbi:MAG: hypothetical protein M1814_001257 [Vezdaea aestivalis]|nr:MAG: hypothetical protein M1814_001257 [Vezdaea aestivalis]
MRLPGAALLFNRTNVLYRLQQPGTMWSGSKPGRRSLFQPCNSPGHGNWLVTTITFVVTDFVMRTSTDNSLLLGATAQATPTTTFAGTQPSTAAITCQGAGQTPCGSICCASNQFCVISGQCEAIKGGSSFNSAGYTTYSTYGAPVRPTTGGSTTVTGGPLPTVPFQTPVGTAGGINYTAQASGGGGLSGGAIAGIVIGVIAGIILLIFLCAACCLGAGFEAIKGFFGLGKKRRTTEIRTEERYSHHGSGHGHSGWFGRNSRVDKPPKKKSSGLGGFGAVTAGLAGLALALGLKRRHDRKDSSTGSSYSYDTSYYDTSESE